MSTLVNAASIGRPGTFEIKDFLRTFNLSNIQTRPDGKPVDEFEFRMNPIILNNQNAFTEVTFEVTGNVDKKLILVDPNDNSVIDFQLSDNTVSIENKLLETGKTYRLLVVGRSENALNVLFPNPDSKIPYVSTVRINPIDLNGDLVQPEFIFDAKNSIFNEIIGTGQQSISQTGILENSDNLFVATTEIRGFLNELEGAKVGYADEFSLLTANGEDTLTITVTGSSDNGVTALNSDNTRGYISVINERTGEVRREQSGKAGKGSADPLIKTVTVDSGFYDPGDTFRIKVAGFEETNNSVKSVAPDTRLGYKIEIKNNNTTNPQTSLALQERIFVINDDNGGETPPTNGGGGGGGSSTNTTFTSTNNPLALESGTVQLAYVGYYGRPADPAGRNFWNQVLRDNNIFYSPRGGVTLNSLSETQRALYQEFIDDFGNSSESNRLFGALTIDSRINLVYRNAFNRDVDTAGLSFWRNAIDQEEVSLPAIALEIVLGARDTDTIRVRNKITSADLFTDALFGGLENRYIGSNAETIGRNFLANIDTSVATTNQVSAGVNSLPILV